MAEACAQTADSKMVYDPITKITFSSYTSTEAGTTYGVTHLVTLSDPYDAIITIITPVSNTTWAGFVSGGTLVWVPIWDSNDSC
jgi:hypothetical protein